MRGDNVIPTRRYVITVSNTTHEGRMTTVNHATEIGKPGHEEWWGMPATVHQQTRPAGSRSVSNARENIQTTPECSRAPRSATTFSTEDSLNEETEYTR